MWQSAPLIPETASTIARKVDDLFFFLLGVTGFFSLLIFFLVILFAVRYRRKSEDERPPQIHGDLRLEIFWAGVPLLIALGMFYWGARLYFEVERPPANAMDVFVVGKQWMWHVQHPHGKREINELHVPVGRPVKLNMTSQDVIHSFFVPAFRVKQDVLPGRYTSMWFEATKAGEYHLFCAEYCGTKHSGMVGKVVAMEPENFEAWLGGGALNEPLEVAGERLFQGLGCATCHRSELPDQRGPSLKGVFGSRVTLASGTSAVADEGYLRESIITPAAKVVSGYQPIMPTYQGQLSEEAIIQLVAYVKSLGGAAAPGTTR